MKCSCGFENEANAVYCVGCGNPLASTQSPQQNADATPDVSPATAQTGNAEPANAQPAAQEGTAAPVYPSPAPANTQPYAQQNQAYQPYYYQPYPVYPPKPTAPSPFTLTDVFVILGFVLAILGVFWYAYILLPTSIIFSVLGWSRKTNRRTNNLSVAALIVGICAIFIKIGAVLHELNLVPEWLSRGII